MRYYTPVLALTGALHEQPPIEQLRYGLEFTTDYKVAVDCRGRCDGVHPDRQRARAGS